MTAAATSTSQWSGAAFYSRYQWALNPMLSLRELTQRLDQELDAFEEPSSEDWQDSEHRLNIYLFTCAIACTLDDYLARRWRLPNLTRGPAPLRAISRAAEWLLKTYAAVRSRVADSGLAEWRRRWSRVIDAACNALVENRRADFINDVRALLRTAPRVFPVLALETRMRVPEGFRCQDLAHHDVFTLVERCLTCLTDYDRPVTVVGPRSAGAYFAPLAAAYLRALGYGAAAWTTIRPKLGLTAMERRSLTAAVRTNSIFIVIDDHQNTGGTMRLVADQLRALGVAGRDLLITAPVHPCNRAWDLPELRARGVRLFSLAHEECYKTRLLASSWGARLLSDLEPVAAVESPSTAILNGAFSRECDQGFQVRLKRLFDLQNGRPPRGPEFWRKAPAGAGSVTTRGSPHPVCSRLSLVQFVSARDFSFVNGLTTNGLLLPLTPAANPRATRGK